MKSKLHSLGLEGAFITTLMTGTDIAFQPNRIGEGLALSEFL